MSETYEILALKYARHANRTRLDNFMLPDDHASPQPIDYFVWVIRNANRTIVVDTGFDAEESSNRNRAIEHDPVEALANIGIDARAVETVVITHLHYDHAGTLDRFPAALPHPGSGGCLCHRAMHVRRSAAPSLHSRSRLQSGEKIYSGRVQFHDGDGEIAPGITVHKAAGHTKGLQCVRVATGSGHVVLASDATHLYENFERRKPFSITVDVAETLKTYTRLEQLATSRAHVVPGHDPLVLDYYPPWKPQTAGSVHRLDVARLK
ncbi:MAG: N-acyl homoserine lactonase family protein [Rhizobiales bacterium]|nr:N-acyl homoserine lactonase family protein [Hyphomicrobiales bacterium]